MQRRYVVVIVALLIVAGAGGLLVTGVCRVRELAARMNCMSHLKQWAFALHNSADTFPVERNEKQVSAFLSGTIPNADLPPEQRLSWLVSALPYMEQSHVFLQIDSTRGAGDPRNQRPIENRFEHLICPSSGEYDRSSRTWKSAGPLTHYVGVAGVGADAAALPLGHPKAGVFGYDRRTAIPNDIPDGTSNTLLLIETSQNPGHWAFGGPATVRGLVPESAPYLGDDRPFGGWHGNHTVWSSKKSHYCIVALADGAVHSLTNATAPEILEALATVAGKESLPANW
ncbi:Uncharacterized protein OS=Planctomyces brasiliensis (strain ATCC 49424 / DSM 5305 / JCM 21570 / NBRC 103401 / IFAM 1448) GN=Plabr_4569 PE=4 SV=1: SBP_bac_10 [Gemmata massiliana]|uniref:DUF1559 domain-containing protein n=1 Tax=Gemmata massiliana TaxID=1210884 RepID=A0A6P2DM37_9BACT|nr:DUF1559 domain-containing protein [Gemmata massiliana]VTS02891.1 Uncharacterized protein OS=Planctomyces brasiliensis (strain ATCC 49424 / DSM 5305 / JCM 21570 / NBRC 103401 / IFAM 1448) GN=Plabr_4569 PE=4 SV=1: SBP_bac_10 [Gemmata massiliana]